MGIERRTACRRRKNVIPSTVQERVAIVGVPGGENEGWKTADFRSVFHFARMGENRSKDAQKHRKTAIEKNVGHPLFPFLQIVQQIGRARKVKIEFFRIFLKGGNNGEKGAFFRPSQPDGAPDRRGGSTEIGEKRRCPEKGVDDSNRILYSNRRGRLSISGRLLEHSLENKP